MKVVFFATPEFVIPVGKILTEHFDLVGVVTSPDSPEGRKKTLTPTHVKKWYMEYLLKNNKEGVILTPTELTLETAVKLRKLHADLFVVAAYGKLIPASILTLPALGVLNIHPSFLPKYRGPSPIQNALLDGKRSLGITIMKMDAELDHGPTLTQWELQIEESDTFESLHQKAFADAAEKLPGIIEKYQKGIIKETIQDHTKATYTEKVLREDGYFSITNPPTKEKLDRMIRAYHPWPSCWTRLHQDFGGQAKKGKVLKLLPDGKIQLEGGKPISEKDLLNGYPKLRPLLEGLK